MTNEAVTSGARLFKASEITGISPRTIQRYRKNGEIAKDRRKEAAIGRTPANKLTQQEKEQILETINKPEFAELPPSQIIPALADENIYIASESTFYRVMRESKQLAHRGKAKPPVNSRPESLKATAPNTLWSWDITYLSTTVAGIHFYLYLIIDIFSRKIVGWEVYEKESAEYASATITRAALTENITKDSLILHSDNGSPMKGATMLATLHRLKITPSFSRPSVSNDNAYSESLFKTMKYRPCFPEKPFDNIEEACGFVIKFVNWYNEIHHHSGINFVTPGQRHRDEDIAILEKRKAVYEAAKAKKPERWSSGLRNWERKTEVILNHGRRKSKTEKPTLKQAA